MRRLCLLMILIHLFLQAAGVYAAEDRPLNGIETKRAQKTIWTANVLRERNLAAPKITNLFFPVIKIPVMLIPQENGLRPFVQIEGVYRRSGWNLFYANGTPLSVNPEDGSFTIYAFLNGRVNEVALVANGPNREAEAERIFVFAPDAKEFKFNTPFDAIILNAGLAHMKYTQTGESNFRSVTGIFTAQYNHPETDSRWGLVSRLDLTVLTFDSSPIDRSPQFLQVHTGGTYRYYRDRSKPWQFYLLAGPSYWTMFSRGSPFGFANLMALAGGTRVRYSQSKTIAWIFDVRYAPIRGLKEVEERGYDVGLTWSKNLPNLHRFEAGVSYSDFGYSATSSKQVHANLFALKIGYTL